MLRKCSSTEKHLHALPISFLSVMRIQSATGVKYESSASAATKDNTNLSYISRGN